jgi:hypothetical protein
MAVLGERQGAIRQQMTVLWSAARGNPPANDSLLVGGKWQPANKLHYSLALLSRPQHEVPTLFTNSIAQTTFCCHFCAVYLKKDR